MASTATYGLTGNPYLDGVLSGVKWGVADLTFSFPQDASYYGTGYGSGENLNNFEAFTATQQDAVRKILQLYSSVANIGFTEVVETATVHGELRYAESDSKGTAWAYYPSTSATGGDAWFNNTKNYYDAPKPGNYGWLTMMHETGHALGLKHPHESRGSFGALPADKDSLEYTVMSYRSYVGGSTTTGYTNGATSYPQTLMMLDIAALQKLYGANYATNAGDTVYSWSATTGEMFLNGIGQGAPAGNKIFLTVWDGGGTDTYDFSNYGGGVLVDLNPGGWTTTSAAQLASLGSGRLAAGNIANALLYNDNPASLVENVVGGAGADTIVGNRLDNVLEGGGGNDTIDGGAGNDTAVYSGNKQDYSWLLLEDDTWSVTDLRLAAPDGTDRLRNVENLQFADALVAIAAPQEPADPPVVPDDPPVVNSAPVAGNDAYTTAKNSKLVVSAASGVLGNDTDTDGNPLTATLVLGPSQGTLVFRADGSFDFTPVKNATGSVSFTYRASDGTDTSSPATVTISVGNATTGGKPGKGGKGNDIEGDLHDAPAPASDAGFQAPGAPDGMEAPIGWLVAQAMRATDVANGGIFVFDVVGYDGDDITISGLPAHLKTYAPDFVFH